jgi:DNA-binding LacI/PurR family transcriptional regulator
MEPDHEPSVARRRATIRDVAAAAGVSKSLVSLVFANPGTVSDERRQRVLEAAERLDFRPNWLARSLAADSGNFVAILVADLHNPVFAEIVDSARRTLAEAGQVGLMTSALLPDADPKPAPDTRVLDVISDLRPRSLLIVGSVPDLPALHRFAATIPVVVASGITAQLATAATVRSDDAAGVGLVVDHLVSLGHTRIAHAGGRGGLVAVERARGYRDAMRRHGLEREIRVAESDYSEEAGFRAARKLLESDEPPTAITAVNDLAAVGVMAAIADSAGPSDASISISGYDNTFLAGIRQISLTSVDPHNVEIGRQAASWLASAELDRASGKEILIPPSLIARGSTRFLTPPGV